MIRKAVVETEAGNGSLRNGSMIKAIEQMMQQLNPEAAYYVGRRTVGEPASS